MESNLFVTCADCLEPLLCEEIKEMGFDAVQSYRGVRVPASNQAIYQAIYQINYCSRIASRVLLPLAQFSCHGEKDLYKRASAAIDWPAYFHPGQTLAIDANVHHPRLRNSLFAAQVLKDAICDSLRKTKGQRPSVDLKRPDLRFNLFIQGGRATISLDTSKVSLSKRGYRFGSLKAPMQETLAAAILRLSGYDESQTLYDPCFGSGTFLLEAAMLATRTPPGFLRKEWGFRSLPEHCEDLWQQCKREADSKRRALIKGKIFGIDRDFEALRACEASLQRAGFASLVRVSQGDFRQYRPEESPNLIVCNPPYGKRLEIGGELEPLYRELGYAMRSVARRPGKAFVLAMGSKFAQYMHLKTTKKHVLKNSCLDCRLLEFDFESRQARVKIG